VLTQDRGPRTRVLLVDDDSDLCALVSTSLNSRCEVQVAHDAERALNLLANEPFDILITDYVLPGMDGLGLVERVRKCERLHELPVVVISGNAPARDEVDRRAIAAGADCFIPKPFTLQELRSTVHSLATKRSPKAD